MLFEFSMKRERGNAIQGIKRGFVRWYTRFGKTPVFFVRTGCLLSYKNNTGNCKMVMV